VSARTRYERFYPGQPLCWKAAAFAHEVNELYEAASLSETPSLEPSDVSSDSDSNVSTRPSRTSSPSPNREVVSFGDSMEERTAVRIVADQLSATPKSVMFIQSPTPTQIIGQLSMLTSHMKFVCYHANSLDLEISAEQAERCAAAYLNKRQKQAHSICDDGYGMEGTRVDSYRLAENLSKMLIRQAAAAESIAVAVDGETSEI